MARARRSAMAGCGTVGPRSPTGCGGLPGLRARGVGLGDTVSVLCPNIPELFELHYAVPLAGAVLNTLNFRLEAETIAYILDHSDCRLVICDSGFSGLLGQAFALMGRALPVVDIVDAQAGGAAGFGQSSYDDLLAADPADWAGPADEWQALALNYTSGTSGRPKGVVYHHRGAYLMAMGTVAGWALPPHPVYLSVVPMFNCNGWNHPGRWQLSGRIWCLPATRCLRGCLPRLQRMG